MVTTELSLRHDLHTGTMFVNAVRLGESGVFASVCTRPRCMVNVEVRGRQLKTRIREFDSRGQNYHHVRVYAYHATHGQVVWAIDLWAEKKCTRYVDGIDWWVPIPPLELYRYAIYADFSLWFWSAQPRRIEFDRVCKDIVNFSQDNNSMCRHASQFGDGDETTVSRRSMQGMRSYVNALRSKYNGK